MGCSTRPRRCSPERVRPAPTCSPGRVVGWCVPPCHTRALALGYEAGTRVIVLRRARLCARKGRQRVAPSTVLCCLRWEVSSRTAEGGVGVGVGWCPPFPHIRPFPLRSEWAKVVFQHLRGALRMRPLRLNQRSSGSLEPRSLPPGYLFLPCTLLRCSSFGFAAMRPGRQDTEVRRGAESGPPATAKLCCPMQIQLVHGGRGARALCDCSITPTPPSMKG